MFEQIKKSLEKDFQLQIETITPLLGGTVNETYLLETNKDEIVARIAKGRNAFPIEQWVYRQFATLEIPHPRVLDYQEKPVSIGYPTILLSRIPGQPTNTAGLTSQKEQEIYEELGRIMRKIHTIKLEGFGFIQLNNDEARGISKDWSSYWQKLWQWENLSMKHWRNFIAMRCILW